MKAIAVVGMTGSGKSVVTDVLKEKGYAYFHFGGVVLDIVKEKGLPLTQENEKPVREALRKEHGMAAMAILLYPKIEEALKTSHVVIDGLYSWSEYVYLKEKLKDQLVVLAIVTDRKERYKRLEAREIRPLSNIDAEKRDFSEIETIEKGGPIAIADYYICNHDSVEVLKEKVNAFISS